jgi:hypothetical protein
MGINLNWINEDGKELGSILDPQNIFSQLIWLNKNNSTICLKVIDPYGDTVFNQLQIPIIMSELEILLTRCRTEEERSKIREMLSLITRSKGETHTYIKFVGD